MQTFWDNKSGFSLLEILVAVVILSMISATIWVSLSRSLDSQLESRLIDERVHEVRSALDRIGRDLSMSFLGTSKVPNIEHKTLFRGTNNQERDRVDFVAFSHLKIYEDAPESDQSEISYFPEIVDNRLVLVRRSDPQLDDDAETGGSREMFLDDIEAFNLKYYDSRRNEWIEEWDTENPAYRDILPAAVDIIIRYRNHRDQVVAMQTRTLLYTLEALN